MKQCEFDGMEMPLDDLLQMWGEQREVVARQESHLKEIRASVKEDKERLEAMASAISRSVELPEFNIDFNKLGDESSD